LIAFGQNIPEKPEFTRQPLVRLLQHNQSAVQDAGQVGGGGVHYDLYDASRKKAAAEAKLVQKNLEKEIMTAKEAALARIAANQDMIADHKQAIEDKKALLEKVETAKDAIMKEQLALIKNNKNKNYYYDVGGKGSRV